jgi:5-methylcytosine-specific restriction endonuclease McrA
MRHHLSICAVFKDEASYLEEWLRFHRGVGVDHFYVYNNGSADDFRTVLEPWLARGVVSLVDWPYQEAQLTAYAHCIARHRRDSRWIAFIDIDEFLFSPRGEDLPSVLAGYESHPGVGANWVIFGADGHFNRPAGLVTRSYLRRASFDLRVGFGLLLRPGGDGQNMGDYLRFCRHVKSIVNPREVIRVLTPHSFRYRKDRLAVDENGISIRDGLNNSLSTDVSASRLRVNHYWSKSIGELEAKIRRGPATPGGYYTMETALRLERYMNAVPDQTILPIVDRIFSAEGPGHPRALPWLADAHQE